jgi:hypothetical protein
VAEVSARSATAFKTLALLGEAERKGRSALFDFLSKHGALLPPADVRTACLNLLPALPERLPQFEKAFGPLPEFEKNRIVALAAEARGDWIKAERSWRLAAENIEPGQDREAKLSAGVIYRHLAQIAEKNTGIEGDGHADPVIFYIKLSLGVDPDYLPAVLQLIGLYRQQKLDKEWHALVQDAVRRFPQESTILMEAVDSAAARKAYKQAAGFARALLILDPINQPVRQRMIDLQISHAHKQMRSKRSDLGWKELEQAAEWERADCPDVRLRINQGLVGLHLDQGAQAEARLHEGVQLAGGKVLGWFRASLEDALMNTGKKGDALLRQELAKALETAPGKDEILSIASVTSSEEARGNKKAVANLVHRMKGWLKKGSGIAWTSAEFFIIGEMLRQTEAFDVLGDFSRAGAKRSPKEPIWRFYELVARTKDDPGRLSFSESDELFDLEEEAADQKDFHMVNRIRRFTGDIETFPPPGRSGGRTNQNDEPNDDEMAGVIKGLGLEDINPSLIASLIIDLGRDKAIAAVKSKLRKSPLGRMMPETLVRGLAKDMVDSVIDADKEPRF